MIGDSRRGAHAQEDSSPPWAAEEGDKDATGEEADEPEKGLSRDGSLLQWRPRAAEDAPKVGKCHVTSLFFRLAALFPPLPCALW